MQINSALFTELERVHAEAAEERISDIIVIDRQIDLTRMALKKIESLSQQNAELTFDSIGVAGGPQ